VLILGYADFTETIRKRRNQMRNQHLKLCRDWYLRNPADTRGEVS
jgi:hypothetical protein